MRIIFSREYYSRLHNNELQLSFCNVLTGFSIIIVFPRGSEQPRILRTEEVLQSTSSILRSHFQPCFDILFSVPASAGSLKMCHIDIVHYTKYKYIGNLKKKKHFGTIEVDYCKLET
jgi:hypothetical protein